MDVGEGGKGRGKEKGAGIIFLIGELPLLVQMENLSKALNLH